MKPADATPLPTHGEVGGGHRRDYKVTPGGQGNSADSLARRLVRGAERRAGELLQEMETHQGGNPNWLQAETSSPPRLEDLGINTNQSHTITAVIVTPANMANTSFTSVGN